MGKRKKFHVSSPTATSTNEQKSRILLLLSRNLEKSLCDILSCPLTSFHFQIPLMIIAGVVPVP